MEKNRFEKNDSLLNDVLTQEPTSFEKKSRTLIDEANEAQKPFSEKLDDVSKKVTGYNLRIKIANTAAG